MYAESKIAQRCSLAAARDGMPYLDPRMVVKGLWSVTMVNLRP